MSDLHRQIFVAEYSALRAAGIQPQYAIPRAWETVELLATSAADKAAEATGRPGPLRELAELHEHAAKCERLLVRARLVLDTGALVQELTRSRDEARRVADIHDAKRMQASDHGEANNHDVLAYGRRCIVNEIDALLTRIVAIAAADIDGLLAEIGEAIDEPEVER